MSKVKETVVCCVCGKEVDKSDCDTEYYKKAYVCKECARDFAYYGTE